MIKSRLFLFLIAFIFCLLCLPKENAAKIRSKVIAIISPSKGKSHPSQDANKLETQNQLLRLQLTRLREWFLEEERLDGQVQQLFALVEKGDGEFFHRRKEYLANILNSQLCALPAQVVFREPIAWSNVIWVNVGEKDNRAMGFEVVAKNSPVVVGKTIVGVVENVTEKKSQVRLITDRTLTLSVRAVRSGEQDRVLLEKLNQIIKLLSQRKDLYGAEAVAHALSGFRESLSLDDRELYLAKGELHGASAPLWRAPSQTLKGVGFNYDFSDSEGPAHSLYIGSNQHEQPPVIKVGDLLVTTGMDGIFPPDFHVAVVSKVFRLREGGCSYRIEAEAVAPNLNTLSEVFVLPPNFFKD